MKTQIIVESAYSRDGSTYIAAVSVNKSRDMPGTMGTVQDFDEVSINMKDFKNVGVLKFILFIVAAVATGVATEYTMQKTLLCR